MTDIRDYPKELQDLSAAAQAYSEKFPDAGVYFFALLPDGSSSVDGGTMCHPNQAVMLVSSLGKTIEDMGKDWTMPPLIQFGGLLRKLCAELFGAHIGHEVNVDRGKKEH